MLDYGAYLKKMLPNPSRRSATYTRQSRFEGSRRQKRAELVRIMLVAREAYPDGMDADELAGALNEVERAAGRPPVATTEVAELVAALEHEGFCTARGDRWGIS